MTMVRVTFGGSLEAWEPLPSALATHRWRRHRGNARECVGARPETGERETREREEPEPERREPEKPEPENPEPEKPEPEKRTRRKAKSGS